MTFKLKSTKVISLLLAISFLLTILPLSYLRNPPAQAFDPDYYVILGPYEYHVVSVNATQGQAISGDWDATPADVLSPPFLVFICDSESLESWKESNNLTKAVNRIPSDRLLYYYDPLFRVDDIPFDNRRSGSFIGIKAPFDDTWNLVMFAGATIIPLTFSWHISVFEGVLLDIVLYSLLGIFALVTIIIVTIVLVKRRREPEEDEMERLLREQEEAKKKKELPPKALGSLEPDGTSDEEALEEFYKLKDKS